MKNRANGDGSGHTGVEQACAGLGRLRHRFDVGGGRLAEVDLIVSTPEEWPTRAEALDPNWCATEYGPFITAIRLFA
jgi:hypothetical protein